MVRRLLLVPAYLRRSTVKDTNPKVDVERTDKKLPFERERVAVLRIRTNVRVGSVGNEPPPPPPPTT
jgi:hypothetical protein